MSKIQGQKRGNNKSGEINKSENSKEFQQLINYKKVYADSLKNPQKFWENIAGELCWFKKWNEVSSGKFINSKWFTGGKTNICYNCLDRNIPLNKNKAAVIWEGENGDSKVYTYQMLLNEVSIFANSLKNFRNKKE